MSKSSEGIPRIEHVVVHSAVNVTGKIYIMSSYTQLIINLMISCSDIIVIAQEIIVSYMCNESV